MIVAGVAWVSLLLLLPLAAIFWTVVTRRVLERRRTR